MRRCLPCFLLGAGLVVLNLLAWANGWMASLIFDRGAVFSDRPWTLLTHALVHVSWYHFLLDGSAFLMLLGMLRVEGGRRRAVVLLACLAGPLVAVTCWPQPAAIGYCGLSGVAHGLMAFTSLEMVCGAGSRSERWWGWGALLLVTGKSIVEACTGTVALAFLHFGLMGVPVVAAHLGGVLGGLLAFAAVCSGCRFTPCIRAGKVAA